MPHYTVGHLDRVAAAVAALDDLPSVVLAGAAYRGVGLPDCIAQGRSAAARVVALVGGPVDGAPAPGARSGSGAFSGAGGDQHPARSSPSTHGVSAMRRLSLSRRGGDVLRSSPRA
jgi:hypothetical protein